MSKLATTPFHWWQVIANPWRFKELSHKILPWLGALALIILLIGLTLVIRSPIDYQQGITVKIMYIHVPFAWLAMLCYTLMTVCGLATLVWENPLAAIALKSAAPIGAMFTALALMTGALWGRPTWGTWWEWDARLTSVLILFFIYLAIIALARAFNNPGKSAKAASILTIIGFLNIPIIKFSVNWWNTLHQPASLFRSGGSAIDPSMLHPLLVMALGFTVLFVAMLLQSMNNEIMRRHIASLRRLLAHKYSPREQSRTDGPRNYE